MILPSPREGGTAVTINGTDLTADATGSYQYNYAAKVAALFSNSNTGVTGTANAAQTTLDLAPTLSGISSPDTYSLAVGVGGSAISVSLDGSVGQEFSLPGMVSALAATTGATETVAGKSGTLANGVSYDISSGSLVLKGPVDGADVTLTEAISGTSISDQTVYGRLSLATDSTTGVTLAATTSPPSAGTGTGLDSLGLSAGKIKGATNIDLFTVLTRTEEAIRAGNVNDINGAGGSIQSQIDNLDIAANQNRGLRSQLGAKAQRVETAMLHQQDAQIDLKQILSRYQDADILQVFNDITQKESAFQAALNVTARVSKISILDYF